MNKSTDTCRSLHSKKRWSIQEMGKKVEFLNPEQLEIEEYRVDDCLITDDCIRCDYLVNVEKKELSIFVELKGADVEHAFAQLKASHIALSSFRYTNVYWLIASGKIRPYVARSSPKLMIRAKAHGATLQLGSSGSPFTISPRI